MKQQFLFFLIIILFGACSPSNTKKKFFSDSDNEQNTDTVLTSKTEKDSIDVFDDTLIEKMSLKYDTLLTATAKFVAGIKTDDFFADLQKKPFYNNHSTLTNNEWEKIKKLKITPISEWIRTSAVHSSNDTATLFYPFSGPDFLYGNAFFPKSKNYILLGLEQIGTLPDISKFSDLELNQYLGDIRYSLRYINKAGYFITSQMGNDLSKQNLDGVTHILLNYLAQTNHKIHSFSHVYIGDNGQIVESQNTHTAGKINGIKFCFFSDDDTSLRNLYYFKVNVADDKIKQHPEFYTFLDKSGTKYTYIKSGSYILHDGRFVRLRKYIMNNSEKILQDDTGIPFWCFDGSNFDINLFGKYTRTIKDFKNYFQTDMADELKKQGNKTLPFYLGYTSWTNEGILLYANRTKELIAKKAKTPKKTTEIKQDKRDKNIISGKPVFKVQFKISGHKLDPNGKILKGLKNVSFYTDKGIYKYTAGSEKTPQACLSIKEKLKKEGFKDAFLVAFLNDKRIQVRDAIAIMNID